MRPIGKKLILSLAGLVTGAFLWTGCTVTVQPTEPTTAPPPPPAAEVQCGPGQYARGGKHVWRQGRWIWVRPTCMARPATWVAGCRWVRGQWVRSGNRYVRRPGRLVCPSTPVGPTVLPPEAPAVTLTCPATHYLRRGRHQWRGGRWIWVAGRCVPRPATWREGCRWVRGSHVRVGNRIVWRAGRLDCPTAAPTPVVVHPTMPPPGRPPATYRPKRCRRGFIHYPGRYRWSSATRQYEWNPGVCVARPPKFRRCRWVTGSWRVYSGRAYYIRPHWVCRGQKVYWTRTGAVWTPPPTYQPFMSWKGCRGGFVHDATGKCVRRLRRCPAGFVLRFGRCYKRVGAGPGPVGPRACRPGFVRRGARCVKAARPPRACRPGFVRRGARCVKAARPPRACRPGFVRRGARCVKAARPRGPMGAMRGPMAAMRGPMAAMRGPMAAMRGPMAAMRGPMGARRPCRPGFVRRGNRCVKRR